VRQPDVQRHRPAGHWHLAHPGDPGRLLGLAAQAPRGPAVGQHTDEILAEELGLSAAEIGALHDAGIVAGPEGAQ